MRCWHSAPPGGSHGCCPSDLDASLHGQMRRVVPTTQFSLCQASMLFRAHRVRTLQEVRCISGFHFKIPKPVPSSYILCLPFPSALACSRNLEDYVVIQRSLAKLTSVQANGLLAVSCPLGKVLHPPPGVPANASWASDPSSARDGWDPTHGKASWLLTITMYLLKRKAVRYPL